MGITHKNHSTCITTWRTISSSALLSPQKQELSDLLETLQFVSVVDSAIRAVCSSVCPLQEGNNLYKPGNREPKQKRDPMLSPSHWALDNYINRDHAASWAPTRSALPHYKPLHLFNQWAVILSPLHSTALPSSVRELPSTVGAENLLVVNMHLMWAANYITWVAQCCSWCRSKWGLQSGDFSTSNNQSVIYISLLSNIFFTGCSLFK